MHDINGIRHGRLACHPMASRTETDMADEPYRRYLCLGCGFLYDEEFGLPLEGIAPGTRWADIPDDWVCFDCGTPKHRFEMIEIPYAESQPGRALDARPTY